MRGLARRMRRKIEHYRVLTVLNDLSGYEYPDITVNQLADRAGVSADRVLQVLGVGGAC